MIFGIAMVLLPSLKCTRTLKKQLTFASILIHTHPSAQLDHMAAAFQHLSHVAVGTAPNVTHLSLPSQMQAMIALATLPFKWEYLIDIIVNNYEIEALTFEVKAKARARIKAKDMLIILAMSTLHLLLLSLHQCRTLLHTLVLPLSLNRPSGPLRSDPPGPTLLLTRL